MATDFKRGTTFNPVVTWTPDVGGLANLIGAVITSQIRQKGTLVASLVPALAQDGLSFRLTAAQGTASWPLGAVRWDIRIVVNSMSIYSDTVELNIVTPETV